MKSTGCVPVAVNLRDPEASRAVKTTLTDLSVDLPIGRSISTITFATPSASVTTYSPAEKPMSTTGVNRNQHRQEERQRERQKDSSKSGLNFTGLAKAQKCGTMPC